MKQNVGWDSNKCVVIDQDLHSTYSTQENRKVSGVYVQDTETSPIPPCLFCITTYKVALCISNHSVIMLTLENYSRLSSSVSIYYTAVHFKQQITFKGIPGNVNKQYPSKLKLVVEEFPEMQAPGNIPGNGQEKRVNSKKGGRLNRGS